MYGDREELAMWMSLQLPDADNDESEALPMASVSTNCDISNATSKARTKSATDE